ncbi:MAG: hypothetical protein ABEH66_03775 [Halobacteriales archaeon]
MGIVNKLRSTIGRGSSANREEDDEPSHRCESCGELYFTDPDVEITSCRGCGGTKIETLA